jgi:DNA-binding IclR family transcriptional regulator
MARPRSTIDPPAPASLLKALAVLDAFDERRPQLSEAELRRELRLPSSTTHRIVRALEARGYLMRTASGHYRLGLAAIALGRRAAVSLDPRAVLDELARETGETAILGMRDPAGLRCVDRVETAERLRLSLAIGAVVPLHAGATSKALLAALDDAELEAILAGPLPRLASGTITDPDELRAEVVRIRARGYATSREETNEGAWGVGVALSGGAGVVSVIGPLTRLSPEAEARAIRAVRAAAERLSLDPAPERDRSAPGRASRA